MKQNANFPAQERKRRHGSFFKIIPKNCHLHFASVSSSNYGFEIGLHYHYVCTLDHCFPFRKEWGWKICKRGRKKWSSKACDFFSHRRRHLNFFPLAPWTKSTRKPLGKTGWGSCHLLPCILMIRMLNGPFSSYLRVIINYQFFCDRHPILEVRTNLSSNVSSSKSYLPT